VCFRDDRCVLLVAVLGRNGEMMAVLVLASLLCGESAFICALELLYNGRESNAMAKFYLQSLREWKQSGGYCVFKIGESRNKEFNFNESPLTTKHFFHCFFRLCAVQYISSYNVEILKCGALQ
jgi:hypothetical protein